MRDARREQERETKKGEDRMNINNVIRPTARHHDSARHNERSGGYLVDLLRQTVFVLKARLQKLQPLQHPP